MTETARKLDPNKLSGLVWAWGQFIDHDLGLLQTDPQRWATIRVPAGDPHFDPEGTGKAVIPYAPTVGDHPVNLNTAWLDASMLYGSDPARAAALRTYQGGHLITSDGDARSATNPTPLPNAAGAASEGRPHPNAACAPSEGWPQPIAAGAASEGRPHPNAACAPSEGWPQPNAAGAASGARPRPNAAGAASEARPHSTAAGAASGARPRPNAAGAASEARPRPNAAGAASDGLPNSSASSAPAGGRPNPNASGRASEGSARPTAGVTPDRQPANADNPPAPGTPSLGDMPPYNTAGFPIDNPPAPGTPSLGDMPPYNTAGLPNDNPRNIDPASLFLAGDPRVNENPVLLGLDTVFLREHNREADRLAACHPDWNDERLYQESRRWVGALVASITYNEFLPALLGADAMPPYRGYDATVDARVSLEFATAAWRIGHSQLDDTLFRNKFNSDDAIPQGDVALRDAYFSPQHVLPEGGIAPFLRGARDYIQQDTDEMMTEDLRSFLFGPPGTLGLDLAAIDIQRGREHRLADFNSVREFFGLPKYADFTALTARPELQAALQSIYGTIDRLDPFVGMVCEDRQPGRSVAPTAARVIVDQFSRLRDGDRFFYRNDPALADRIGEIEQTRLGDIIGRNLGETFSKNAFYGDETKR